MGLPNTPRGGGPRRAYIHAPYVGTEKGERWGAWIAGPAQWFVCHASTRTKPCLEVMTEGALTCAFCGAGKLPQVMGYVPLYRTMDARPVHVIVYELQRESIDKLKLHQQVQVGRGVEATDSVFIAPLLSGGRPFTSTLPERMVPVDLTETLLKMWKMPELEHWYRSTHGKRDQPAPAPVSDNALSLKQKILDGEPRKVGDLVDTALGERAPEVLALARKRDAIKRGEEAARNGKSSKNSG